MRVMGDEPRLVRAVENLVDNAVSFSPPGAGVTVSATRSANSIAIVVDDRGPGVPPERREAIFRRFHSERSEDDFARHSGLGLAIAKTIVEAMGGSIAVENAPSGSGARFAIRLPVA
jgi:two-component system sensor histidine kinase ChvG